MWHISGSHLGCLWKCDSGSPKSVWTWGGLDAYARVNKAQACSFDWLPATWWPSWDNSVIINCVTHRDPTTNNYITGIRVSDNKFSKNTLIFYSYEYNTTKKWKAIATLPTKMCKARGIWTSLFFSKTVCNEQYWMTCAVQHNFSRHNSQQRRIFKSSHQALTMHGPDALEALEVPQLYGHVRRTGC